MPAVKKGHRKVMIYVSPQFWEEVKAESKQRKSPLGELVEEAFYSRVRIIRK